MRIAGTTPSATALYAPVRLIRMTFAASSTVNSRGSWSMFTMGTSALQNGRRRPFSKRGVLAKSLQICCKCAHLGAYRRGNTCKVGDAGQYTALP
jgi:hypothetical protein